MSVVSQALGAMIMYILHFQYARKNLLVYKLKPYTVGMLIKLDLKRFLVFVLSELFSMAYRWYITSEHAPILLIHHSWVSHVNIISLNNIYLMTFQHTIIQIYIYTYNVQWDSMKIIVGVCSITYIVQCICIKQFP